MWALETLYEPLWQRLTWTLLHFLWQGAAVAAVAATLLRAWPPGGAHSRYLICLSALVAMAMCPAVTFVLTEVPQSVTASRDNTETRVESPAASATDPQLVANDLRKQRGDLAAQETQPAFGPSEAAPVSAAVPPSSPRVEDLTGLSEPVTWRARLRQGVGAIHPYTLIVWIAGVLALAVRLSISWLHVRWLTWDRLAIPTDLAAKATTLGRRLGLRFAPRVCLSEKIREAIVVGLWRPLVLVPASWITEMTPEVLEAVIAHELAHIRRWDLWVNLLQRLVEVFLFYHPAVWWLSRRVSLEREMCTDELAVGVTNKRVAYATALEQLGLMRLGQSAPQFGASIGNRRTVLLNRVGNILGLSASDKKGRWWPVALTALAVPLTIWLASTGIVSSTGNETAAEEVSEGTAEPRRDTPPGNLQAKLSAGVFRDDQQWLRVFVHNSSEDEWGRLESGVCPPEILVDDIAYRSTRTETGPYAKQHRSISPRSRGSVAEFTLDEQWVTVDDAKPLELTPGTHTIRAILYVVDRDTSERGPKMLTNAIELGTDGRAVDSRDVRIRILGGEQKKPLAGLELSVRHGRYGSKNLLTATTEDDGGASFRLSQGYHTVSFTSPRELPYLPFRMPDSYRPSRRTIYVHKTTDKQIYDLVLADPCELVLRAVDVDTGEGIPDVRFALENAAGEIWSQPIVNETIRPPSKQRFPRYDPKDKSQVTDKDGYFRRLVGPRHDGWIYWVEVWPDGYRRAYKGVVKIDTSLGTKKAEHTFLFRREAPEDLKKIHVGLAAGVYRDGKQWLSVHVRNDSPNLAAHLGKDGIPFEILVDDLPWEPPTNGERYHRGAASSDSTNVEAGAAMWGGEFTLDDRWKDEAGKSPQLATGRHAVRAVVYVKDDSDEGRGREVLSRPIEIGADGRAYGSHDVKISFLGGVEKKPLKGIGLTVTPIDRKESITATTQDDGGASFKLVAGRYTVDLLPSEEVPYLNVAKGWTNRDGPLWIIHVAEIRRPQRMNVNLASPCELILRAVDADTGKGVPGVIFCREAGGDQLGAQAIHHDTICPREIVTRRPRLNSNDKSLMTDEQGYYRRHVGANEWTYSVWSTPPGYESVKPDERVKIETPLGKKRAEHSFLVRRTSAERPVKIAPAEEDASSWGDSVRGVKMRLHASTSRWAQGQMPEMRVDFFNVNNQNLKRLGLLNENWAIELDGRLYRVRRPDPGGEGKVRAFGPGTTRKSIPVPLHADFALPDGSSLEFAPGKHTVRIHFTHNETVKVDGQYAEIHLVSNPLEIEIVSSGPEALLEQLNDGTLSDDQIRQITDKVLAIQGDLKQEWDPAWGNWLEVARLQGKVSDADFERYAKQSNPVWQLDVKEAIAKHNGRLGLSFKYRQAGGRVTSKTTDHGLIITHRIVGLRVKDVPIDWSGNAGEWTFTARAGHGGGIFREPREIEGIEKLIPGKHEVMLLIEGEIYEADRPKKILHRWKATLKDDIELHRLVMPQSSAVDG